MRYQLSNSDRSALIEMIGDAEPDDEDLPERAEEKRVLAEIGEKLADGSESFSEVEQELLKAEQDDWLDRNHANDNVSEATYQAVAAVRL
jgi:sirohydrochlorin ferrochelatase